MNWDSDDTRTLNEEYTAVPLDEKEYFFASQVEGREYLVGDLFKAVLVRVFHRDRELHVGVRDRKELGRVVEVGGG
jgi:hypothetical protein